MQKQMNELELLACFEEALTSKQFQVFYQPKINHSTGRMIGAEALMRWIHPVYGMQYPSNFIPVLEKHDLIYRADLNVFESVCSFLKSCLETGVKPVPISVNMSRYDIYRKDYVDQIEKLREQYEIPIKYLHVEVTETSAIGGMELVSNALSKLHQYGYVVEMDDFGSGYSSFWNPASLETLIFNHFVGGAVIFTYQNGKVEILRVNQKYIKELGMNMTEKDVIRYDPWRAFDEKNRRIYEETILRAIKSNDEESCETWRTICSKICGEDKMCIRSFIRMIGKTETQYLFYAMVQNITTEKLQYQALYSSEKRFRFASEQINVYAWEYMIATRQMRPCYRCMRDLHLPPLVENYPEPVIEMGIFPLDYADMYRDWHKQLERGVEHLEAIIPLTVGRVPFHVRYTLETDEAGKPLKAYGSAALVVDNE